MKFGYQFKAFFPFVVVKISEALRASHAHQTTTQRHKKRKVKTESMKLSASELKSRLLILGFEEEISQAYDFLHATRLEGGGYRARSHVSLVRRSFRESS
jgi:hypothetical protein